MVQHRFKMYPEFGKGVPFCCLIQQYKDNIVKWFWEKPVKDRYRTLEDGQ